MAGLRIGIDTGDSAAKIEAMRRALAGLQGSGNDAASSAAKQRDAVRSLMAVLNPTGKALKEVAEAQRMLSKAFYDGKINRQQYDQANASLQGYLRQLDGTAAAAERLAAKTAEEAAAFKSFLSIMDPTATALQKLAEREDQLNKYHAEGKIPTDKYKEYTAVLAQAKAELNGTAEAERQLQQSQQLQRQQLQQLIAELLPTAAALDQLTVKRRQLGEAFSRGDITAAQFAQGNAALDRMKNSLNGVTDAQRRAAQTAQEEATAIQGIRDRLDPIGAQLQRVAREMVMLNEQFAKRNIGEHEHTRLMDNLRAEEAELEKLRVERAKAAAATGTPAHQIAFADKWLPAQLHDVASSLSAGMPIQTVLTQQGTQIKDLYGSVGEAAKGALRYVLGFITPLKVSAGILGGIAYTAYKIMTTFAGVKNQILLSGRSLQEFKALQSVSIDVHTNAPGVSFADANKATALAAGNAGIAYNDIGKAATVAAEAHHILGSSIEDTIREYGSLRSAGTDAIVSLNDQYGFLTEAEYKHIRQLQDSGHAIEAGTTAQQLYIDKMREVTKEAEKSLPAMKRMWLEIQGAISDSTNDMAIHMGYGSPLQTAELELREAKAGLANVEKDRGSWLGMYTEKNHDRAQARVKAADAQVKKLKAEAEEAAKQSNDSKIKVNNAKTVDDLMYANLGAEKKKVVDRKKIAAQLKESGASEAQIAEALAGYDENHKKADKAANRSGESMLRGLREQTAALDAQYAAIKEGAKDPLGYEELTESAKALEKFNEQIKLIKASPAGKRTDADKDMLSNEGEIRAQLEMNALTEDGINQQKALLDIIKKQADAHKKSLESVEAMNKATATAYEVRGMGSRDAERYKQRKSINDDPELSGEDKEAKLQALENSYRQVDAAQQDWVSAASTAWKDFKAQSQDVAGTVSSGMKSAFDQATSAMTTFITTGKLSFADLLNTAANAAAKIGMQYASMSLFGGASTGAASYTTMFSTGGIVGKPKGYATGGHIKGPGTGTSDDIPAMLSNGEFVVNEAATRKNRGLLEAINSSGGSTMARFAEGGSVGGGAFSQQGASSGVTIDMKGMTVNASGAEEGKQAAQAMSEALLQIMEARIAQSEGRNKQFVINQTTKSGGVINRQIRGR